MWTLRCSALLFVRVISLEEATCFCLSSVRVSSVCCVPSCLIIQKVMWPRCFSAWWRRTKIFIYPAVLYGQKAELGIRYGLPWSNRTILGAIIGTVGEDFRIFPQSFDVAQARGDNMQRGVTGQRPGGSRASANAFMLGACEDQTVCTLRSDSRNFAARGISYLIRTDFEMLVSPLILTKCHSNTRCLI